MRAYTLIVGMLLCGLLLPAWGAETPEATAKRVKQLENARLVLQGDLAATQQVLEITRTNLKTTQKNLDEETARRKELQAKLEAMQKQIADLIVITGSKTDAATTVSLGDRVSKLEKAHADLAAKQIDDAAAIRKELAMARDNFAAKLAELDDMFSKKIAALRDDLGKETKDRIAGDDAANKSRQVLAAKAKKDRVNTAVMGGLLTLLKFMK